MTDNRQRLTARACSQPPVPEHRQQRLFQFLEEPRGGLDIAAAVKSDFPEPSGLVIRSDGVAVHAVLFRALDPEGLAGEVEIPFARGTEERQYVEEVRVRLDGVAVAHEVFRDGNAERRAPEHQERSVERPSVESDEPVKARDRLPELR